MSNYVSENLPFLALVDIFNAFQGISFTARHCKDSYSYMSVRGCIAGSFKTGMLLVC